MKTIIKLLCTSLLFISGACFAKQEKLTLLLDWFINPDHATLLFAQDEGYFKKNNLDVEIISPGDPADPPKLAAAKKVDLALYYQLHLMVDVDKGLPLTQVGTLLRGPLNAMVVDDTGPIKNMQDFKGKKIGYASAGVDVTILEMMLKKGGLTLKDIDLINVHYNLTQSLLTHRVDGIIGIMRNIEIPQLELAGFKPRAFYPENYGVPAYDELVFIANTDSAKDPRIARFLLALQQATQELTKHPDSSWKKIVARHPDLNTDFNKLAYKMTIPYFIDEPAEINWDNYTKLRSLFLKK